VKAFLLSSAVLPVTPGEEEFEVFRAREFLHGSTRSAQGNAAIQFMPGPAVTKVHVVGMVPCRGRIVAVRGALARASLLGSALQVEQLSETSGSGSVRMLTRAGLCLAMGVVLVAGYHTPVWLVPFGIVFEGVSLAWFYLIQKDCEKGHFFPSPALNTLVSYLLRWELHMAVAIMLTATQIWSFGALLKFWMLPFLVMQATLATTTNSEEDGTKKQRQPGSIRKSPSMTSLELLFPELESTASQVSDLLDIAQHADQSSVFRRQVSGDQEDEEDWQFGVALHQIPMYQLQRLSKNLSKELQRARSGSFGSNTDLAGLANQPQSGSEENLQRLREASKAKSKKRSSKKKTPLEQVLNIIGWPARYLFREMWLWTERDLTLYAVVSLFLVEVYVGTQYFAWSPVCLLYPILSSSSGSRKAQELQDELVMIFAPEYRFWRRVNIPVAIQVLVCHNMTIYLLIVLLISPGQRDLYVGKTPCWQTFVWAFLLLVLSIVGMVGTNLVWAVGSIRPSIPQKVALMICQSLANQGSIFRWSRDQRCHLKNKGTDADPFDPQRGLAYRYIGWSLMHKTPKMIEATRSVDVHDLLLDQVVMFQADVDAWWNLSFSHAIPAFATLLWGEELFLGWVIAGCARSVLALHINLILLRFQPLWCPQKVMVSASGAEEEEDLMARKTFTRQVSEQTRRKGTEHQPALLRSAGALQLNASGSPPGFYRTFSDFKAPVAAVPRDRSALVLCTPVFRRPGGFLLALPTGSVPPNLLSAGAEPDAQGMHGPSTTLEVPAAEEDEVGGERLLDGESLSVLLVDLDESAAAYLEPYDQDAGVQVVPFDPVHPDRFPDVTTLLQLTRAWCRSMVHERASFYTAAEEDGEMHQAPLEEAPAKGAKPKRVTTAQLQGQLASLLEVMPRLTGQLEQLTTRQQALEDQFASRPAFAAASAPAVPPDLPLQRPFVFPRPKGGRDAAPSVFGPPPRGRPAPNDPPPSGGLTAQPVPEAPAALMDTEVGAALTQQSQALTMLVSHFIAQASEGSGDFGIGTPGASALSSKGSAKREKLLAELASHSGAFMVAVAQSGFKRMNPTSPPPRSLEDLRATPAPFKFTEYVERYGGYQSQRDLGLIQFMLSQIADLLLSGEVEGTLDLISLMLVAVEQAAQDHGKWDVAYVLSLFPDPPGQVFTNKGASQNPRLKAWAPLCPAPWATTALAYLKEADAIMARRSEATGSTAAAPKKDPFLGIPGFTFAPDLGGFVHFESLRRPPNSSQRKALDYLERLVKACGAVESVHVPFASRRSAQLIARLSEISDQMTRLGPVSDPYGPAFPGVSPAPSERRAALSPYQSLCADRLKLSGKANWDPTPYLEDSLYLAFREPQSLLLPQVPVPSSGDIPSPCLTPAAELEKVARLWDRNGLLVLCTDGPPRERPYEGIKLFNAAKSATTDRQIADRRGRNWVEGTIAGPSRELPTGVALSCLCVRPAEQTLSICVTDRKDYYHQLMVPPRRSLRNVLVPPVATTKLRDTQAFRDLVDGGARADSLPESLYLGFKAVLQGDALGVEFACSAHSNLLAQHGLLSQDSRLLGSAPAPVGGPDDLIEGLCIDDYYAISVRKASRATQGTPKGKPERRAPSQGPDLSSSGSLPARAHRIPVQRRGLAVELGSEAGGAALVSPGLSQAERCFLKAKEVYRQENIYGSDEKDAVGLELGTCTGAELDSSPYTRSLGLALLGPPREKRIALAAITLETARLTRTTDHLHLSLLGGWTSALLYRRPLMSVLSTSYSLVDASKVRPEHARPLDLPRPVANELVLLAALSHVIVTDISAPWCEELFATDSSEEKGEALTLLCRNRPTGVGEGAAKVAQEVSRSPASHVPPAYLSGKLPLACLAFLSPSLAPSQAPDTLGTSRESYLGAVFAASIALRGSSLGSCFLGTEGLESPLLNELAVVLPWATVKVDLSPGQALATWASLLLPLRLNVAKCSLQKGRSPSSALARGLRRQAAVAVAFGLFPQVPFCPTRLTPADHPSRGAEIPPPGEGFLSEDWTWPQIRSLSALPRLRRWAATWVRFALVLSSYRPCVDGCYRGQHRSYRTFVPSPLDFDATLGFPGEGPPGHSSSSVAALLWLSFVWLQGWFVQGASPPPSHGLPLRTSGDLSRAERRQHLELPQGRAVEPKTRQRREVLWQAFLEWLDANGVERGIFLHTDGLIDIDTINAILARYGRALYQAGKPYSHFSETLNSFASRVPKLRRLLQPAWDVCFAWRKAEPSEHHAAMPWQVLFSLVSVSLLWGWPLVGAALALAWGGLLRIGEVITAKRSDLTLPKDIDFAVNFALLSIGEPKTRFRAARHQSVKVDHPDILEVLDLCYGRLSPSSRLWPFSGQTLRSRFRHLCGALRLPSSPSAGRPHLELASLRAGGASWMMLVSEDAERIRRRGRWLNSRVMEIYVQEVTALQFMPVQTDETKSRIRVALESYKQVLQTVSFFSGIGVPPQHWFFLYSAGMRA
ncbi:fat-7, partial [Symbiodinium microadriaticum]